MKALCNRIDLLQWPGQPVGGVQPRLATLAHALAFALAARLLFGDALHVHATHPAQLAGSGEWRRMARFSNSGGVTVNERAHFNERTGLAQQKDLLRGDVPWHVALALALASRLRFLDALHVPAKKPAII